jgi:hypothetical protein
MATMQRPGKKPSISPGTMSESVDVDEFRVRLEMVRKRQRPQPYELALPSARLDNMAKSEFRLRAREWLADIPEWLWTVVVRWSTLIGGGVVSMGLYLWDRTHDSKHLFSITGLLAIIFVAFAASGYDAWHTERRARNAAIAERDAALGVNPPKTLKAALRLLIKSYRDTADAGAALGEAEFAKYFWEKHPFTELERYYHRLESALPPGELWPLTVLAEQPPTHDRIRDTASILEHFTNRVPEDILW